jgi:hypothetical protein
VACMAYSSWLTVIYIRGVHEGGLRKLHFIGNNLDRGPYISNINTFPLLISVAALSKAWVCWDYGFDSRWEHRCLFLVSVVCCQVEVTTWG